MENETQLQDWLIHRFIARPDRFAIQAQDGKWSPARESIAGLPYAEQPLIAWSREFLHAHLSGDLTAGHYMLSADSKVKLFALDIDFTDQGFCPVGYNDDGSPDTYEIISLRDEWRNRASVHRSWMKTQLRKLAHIFASAIHTELEIPTAAAYSGNKGIHVYGFTGELDASEARLAAEMVMKSVNALYGAERGTNFELSRGTFEWTDTNANLDYSYSNVTIEVFPKQDEVNPDSFGNLMALPLGINRKNPADPKFFFDLRAPMGELVPIDPIWALGTENPWETANAG